MATIINGKIYRNVPGKGEGIEVEQLNVAGGSISGTANTLTIEKDVSGDEGIAKIKLWYSPSEDAPAVILPEVVYGPDYRLMFYNSLQEDCDIVLGDDGIYADAPLGTFNIKECYLNSDEVGIVFNTEFSLKDSYNHQFFDIDDHANIQLRGADIAIDSQEIQGAGHGEVTVHSQSTLTLDSEQDLYIYAGGDSTGNIELKSITDQDEIVGAITLNDTGITINADLDATGNAYLIIEDLPTSDPQVAGAVWNDNGTLKISSGQ